MFKKLERWWRSRKVRKYRRKYRKGLISHKELVKFLWSGDPPIFRFEEIIRAFPPFSHAQVKGLYFVERIGPLKLLLPPGSGVEIVHRKSPFEIEASDGKDPFTMEDFNKTVENVFNTPFE